MNIFYKRPLSLILCIMLGGFVAFSRSEIPLRIVLIALVPILAALSFILKSKRRMCILASVSLAISIFCSYLYFDCWFYPSSVYDGEIEIVGHIESKELSGSTTKLYIRTSSIDDNGLARYRFLTYAYSDDLTDIDAGDEISFSATISDFSDVEAYANFKDYYLSMGLNGILYVTSDIEKISDGDPPILSSFTETHEWIRRRAVMASDEEAGNLLIALLIGERNMLSGQLKLDFTRIGINHILAVSGMHVTIIAYGVGKLLEIFRIGKKTRTVISCLFTIAYMAFIGFPVPVVRAGIMLIISSCLYLFAKQQDSVTSLVLSAFIMCVMEPFVIFDLALWLSVFATLGVIIYSEYNTPDRTQKEEKRPIYIRFLIGIKDGVMSSIFATCTTLLMTTLSFGGISLLAPISTLIVSPIVEAIMYIGTFALIFGELLPIGQILRPLTDLTAFITGALSSIPSNYISSGYTPVLILVVILSIAFFGFLIINIKTAKMRRKTVAMLGFGLLTVYSIGLGFQLTTVHKDDIIMISESDSSSILIKDEGHTTLVSSSSYTDNEAYSLSGCLSDLDIMEIDTYYVTHYNFALLQNLDILLQRVMVSEVSLPEPRNEVETTVYKAILGELDEYRCAFNLRYETDGEDNDEQIKDIHRVLYTHGSQKTALRISLNGIKYLYLSSGMLNSDTANRAYSEMSDCDVLLFGSYGEKYKETTYFHKKYDNVKRIILNSDRLFLGQKAYEFYNENGCEIYSHPSIMSVMLD